MGTFYSPVLSMRTDVPRIVSLSTLLASRHCPPQRPAIPSHSPKLNVPPSRISSRRRGTCSAASKGHVNRKDPRGRFPRPHHNPSEVTNKNAGSASEWHVLGLRSSQPPPSPASGRRLGIDLTRRRSIGGRAAIDGRESRPTSRAFSKLTHYRFAALSEVKSRAGNRRQNPERSAAESKDPTIYGAGEGGSNPRSVRTAPRSFEAFIFCDYSQSKILLSLLERTSLCRFAIITFSVSNLRLEMSPNR
jgi:hypothetical protein